MLVNNFNIITEDGKFYGVMDAIDYDGKPIILYHKTLTRDILVNFIYRVKMENQPTRDERLGKINSSASRLRVCKKLLAANVKFTKQFMKEYIDLCKNRLNELAKERFGTQDELKHQWYGEIINDWTKEYEEWKRVLKAYSYKSDSTKLINDMDVVKAKEFPITDMVKFNSQKFAKCIFHNDNTPSMKYYPSTNTVHCFSCGKTGDSIQVAQTLFSENFINAVKRLTNK